MKRDFVCIKYNTKSGMFLLHVCDIGDGVQVFLFVKSTPWWGVREECRSEGSESYNAVVFSAPHAEPMSAEG